MPKFAIGDIVAPHSDPSILRSGCSAYRFAIVILAEPMVIVSQGGDMKWCNVKEGDLEKLDQITMPRVIKKLQRRLYDDLPEWADHKFVVSILRNLYSSGVGGQGGFDRRDSTFQYHARKKLGRAITVADLKLLKNFITIQSMVIPEEEVSAPFQHDWARRQHWLNAVLRRLRLPPVPVKIPKSYTFKWGDILKVENGRVVDTGKVSFASPFATYWASKGYEVTKP